MHGKQLKHYLWKDHMHWISTWTKHAKVNKTNSSTLNLRHYIKRRYKITPTLHEDPKTLNYNSKSEFYKPLNLYKWGEDYILVYSFWSPSPHIYRGEPTSSWPRVKGNHPKPTLASNESAPRGGRGWAEPRSARPTNMVLAAKIGKVRGRPVWPVWLYVIRVQLELFCRVRL